MDGCRALAAACPGPPVASDLFWHGGNANVFSVRQGSRPLALKPARPVGPARGEADALAEWPERGIAELAVADGPRVALTLERLDASRSLASHLPRLRRLRDP